MKIKILRKITTIFFMFLFISIIIIFSFFLVSCNKNSDLSKQIKLFNTNTQTIENISLNNYLEGVVAAEMSSDAPLEALKAQAIIARTFTYKFLETSTSKYEGADISTDINEAQAYNSELVNENIKKAVKETNNETIKYNGEYINAWFHSNSGGQTALAKEGFSLVSDEPPYIKSVTTKETDNNTQNYSWSYTFSKDDILSALRNMGASVSNISTLKKGEVGPSGRCLTFIVGGKEISASTFRLNIGSTKLKSTLIDNITISSDSVSFSGRGYGHGVGLSQEYAIVLANQGKNYKDIINYFFEGVNID